ncbi:MAG: response regulator transcription factor [Candidatus Thiodiazotropha sp.]
MHKTNGNTHKNITVMLADDHPLLRNGFIEAMGESKEIKVIYSTDNPQDACDAFSRHKPDVVVMDILFKEKMTGLDAIKIILSTNPLARIIVLSQHDQARLIKETYQLGALAFIPKDVEPELLIDAIKKAAIGEKHFLPEIAQKLAYLTAEHNTDPKALLNQREFDVYRLIAQDHTNVEIAEELGLSQKTVNNTLFALRSKLGLRRNTEITKHALKHGIIKLDDDT